MGRIPAWRPSPGWRSGASTPSAPAPTDGRTPSSSASGTGLLCFLFLQIPPSPNPNFCCSCNSIHPLLLYNCARYLSVEKSRSIFVRLFPEPGRVAKEQPPLARFLLRVSWAGPPRRTCVSPGTGYLLLSIPQILKDSTFLCTASLVDYMTYYMSL